METDMPSTGANVTDPTIRDFSLAFTAEGKKTKSIRTYTDATSWLQKTQEIDDWPEVSKSHVHKHIALILDMTPWLKSHR